MVGNEYGDNFDVDNDVSQHREGNSLTEKGQVNNASPKGDSLTTEVGGEIAGAGNVVGSKDVTSQSATHGASVVGQDQIKAEVEGAHSVAIGKEIQQTVHESTTNTSGGSALAQEASVAGNVVNVNLPQTWNPGFAHGQDILSVNAEQRLSEDIRELRTTINGLAQTVGSLDKTLSVEVQSANDRIDGIQNLIKEIVKERDAQVNALQALVAEMIKDRDNPRPAFDQRTSKMLLVIGVLILLLLAVIAWNSLVRHGVAANGTTALFFLRGLAA